MQKVPFDNNTCDGLVFNTSHPLLLTSETEAGKLFPCEFLSALCEVEVDTAP